MYFSFSISFSLLIVDIKSNQKILHYIMPENVLFSVLKATLLILFLSIQIVTQGTNHQNSAAPPPWLQGAHLTVTMLCIIQKYPQLLVCFQVSNLIYFFTILWNLCIKCDFSSLSYLMVKD